MKPLQIASIGWLLVSSLAYGVAQGTEEIEVLKTTNGVRFGLLGEPNAPVRRPTVFVLSGKLEYSLQREPYNIPCNILRRAGFLCVSVDLPAHGENQLPGEPADLLGWRRRTETGQPWLRDFQSRASSVLDLLIEQGRTRVGEVAVYGTSRGGFAALQWAAADPRIRCVAALTPVTDLRALDEFSGIDETKMHGLSLVDVAARLTGIPIWIAIGNNDRRVGTLGAMDFARAVIQIASSRSETAKIELHVVTGMPHPRGHLAHSNASNDAAEWILRHTAPEKETPRR